MPYGVVMASGGAAGVAASAELYDLATALTVTAVLQALLIPAIVVTTQRGITVPHWRFGLFTIALGLAVIAENLQRQIPFAAYIALALAWLATLTLGAWWIVLACGHRGCADTVDGTWFLAPAALLGDAAATAITVGAGPSWVAWCSIAVCLAGIAGYVLVIIGSGHRLWNHGLKDSPMAPWWISAGCGGLAAAAAATISDNISDGNLSYVLDAFVPITWGIGTVLLITVLAGCVWYAWQRPHTAWQQVWTPVFSIAVYADGTDHLARLTDSAALHVTAIITVTATLVLWAANTALSLWHNRQWARPGP